MIERMGVADDENILHKMPSREHFVSSVGGVVSPVIDRIFVFRDSKKGLAQESAEHQRFRARQRPRREVKELAESDDKNPVLASCRKPRA